MREHRARQFVALHACWQAGEDTRCNNSRIAPLNHAPVAWRFFPGTPGTSQCEQCTGFLSVSHRSTLKEFHDTLVMLKNDGTSEIVPLPKPASDQAPQT